MGNCLGASAEKPQPTVASAVKDQAEAVAKSTQPEATKAVAQAEVGAVAGALASQSPARATTTIYVIYYSMYGHVRVMAEAMAEAITSVEGCSAGIYQVPEILPQDVLDKMHAPPKAGHPIIDPHKLPEADGFVFGFPTRFGMMASQFKAFFDATGGLWQTGQLHGKPATLFTSTASQGGGQEATIWSAVTQLAHHGMLYVPPGYAAGGVMFGVDAAKGGSPYGAGTLAAPDGSRMPSAEELEAAKIQAIHFAKVAQKLK